VWRIREMKSDGDESSSTDEGWDTLVVSLTRGCF